jgi:hypothetical protein
MLTGKGVDPYTNGSELFLTKKWLEKRNKGLLDKDNIDSSKLTYYGISGADGGGSTDPESFEIKQYPFPTNASIRSKKTLDYRKVRPEIGD